MGWFLSSKDKTRKAGRAAGKRAAGRAAAEPRPWDPKRTLLALKATAWVAAVVAVVVGWVYLEDALTEYASARHAVQASATSVVIDAAPSWMSQYIVDELAELVGTRAGSDPLDASALRASAAALAGNPWVREVHQVQRAADGLIHVRATFREPIAVIRHDGGYVLVDREGVRLPGMFERHQLPLLGLLEITDVASPAPRVGVVWPGADVQAGLALAGLMREQPFVQDLDAIEVAGPDDRGRLNLTLFAGRRALHWGMPLGQGQPLEPATDQDKLYRLTELAAMPGGLKGDPRVAVLNSVGGRWLYRSSIEHAEAEARHNTPGLP